MRTFKSRLLSSCSERRRLTGAFLFFLFYFYLIISISLLPAQCIARPGMQLQSETFLVPVGCQGGVSVGEKEEMEWKV